MNKKATTNQKLKKGYREEPKKESNFEHKIIKDARKMAKDLKKGKPGYGK